MSANTSPARRAAVGGSARRRLCFRLAAVLLGLSPLLLLELVLRLIGWSDPALDDDPYVGFRENRPLFVLNEQDQVYEIAKPRRNWFCAEQFAARKPAGGYRIFCLGGSTVQGRPFAKETAFSSWLQINLRLAEPSRHWEVVNCGGVSYASYRLANVLSEVLEYSPDLIILYTGHNEFLEDRSYGHVRTRLRWLAWLDDLVSRSRAGAFIQSQARSRLGSDAESAATQLPGDVDAWLDKPRGLDHYHRDLKWQRQVIQHYAYNLRRMVGMCRRAGVPVLLVNPVSNLRDSPPFKAAYGDHLRDADRQRWRQLVEEGRAAYGHDLRKAVARFEQARTIDDQHAGLHFDLGKCYERIGRFDAARESYIAAKDNDICPLRMLERMHDVLHTVARRTKTPLIDARQIIEQDSPHQIAGNFLLLDHVHPAVPGHQRIAAHLFQHLRTTGVVEPAGDWQQKQAAAFAAHLAALDRDYFLQGMARLEGLKRWARRRYADPAIENEGQDSHSITD